MVFHHFTTYRLKEMDVLCSFKIKKECQKLDNGCTHDQLLPYPNEDLKPHSGTSCVFQRPKSGPFNIMKVIQNLDHGYIKDQWLYPNQDLDPKPQSGIYSILKSPKSDVLCHFKIKSESQNMYHGCVKRPVTISKSRSRCQPPVRNLQCPPKLQMKT